jgi:hypothetical protein
LPEKNMDNFPQRVPGESEYAYAAYRIYRELGPGRSLAEAWQSYRQRPRRPNSARGRPRVRQVAMGRPSGQWTKWAKQFYWRDRAAAYDSLVDTKRCRESLARLQQQEEQRSQFELTTQKEFEEQVWKMEALLDRADCLPLSGVTQWKREVVGRKVVVATKTQMIGLRLSAYARLVRATNETARLAMVGAPAAAPEKRAQYGQDGDKPSRSRSSRREVSLDSDSTCRPQRLPGESPRAFRAFCAYRDLGPARSLTSAWMADHPKGDPAAQSERRQEPPAKVRRSVGHWPRWSVQWHWAERTAVWDAMVAGTKRVAHRQRRKVLDARRRDFEVANQERLERRYRKIYALANQADNVPIVDVRRTTEERVGNRVVTTKTFFQGLNLSGYAALNQQLRETGWQACGVWPDHLQTVARSSPCASDVTLDEDQE